MRARATQVLRERSQRDHFCFLSSVCPEILFVGDCNDVDYLMLNVIVEGLRGEGDREYGYSDHQDQVVHQDSRRLRTSRVRQRFRQGFRIPPGFAASLCMLRFASLR